MTPLRGLLVLYYFILERRCATKSSGSSRASEEGSACSAGTQTKPANQARQAKRCLRHQVGNMHACAWETGLYTPRCSWPVRSAREMTLEPRLGRLGTWPGFLRVTNSVSWLRKQKHITYHRHRHNHPYLHCHIGKGVRIPSRSLCHSFSSLAEVLVA